MANTIDSTLITTFANLTENDVTGLNTTIGEIVTKHDALANAIGLFGNFTITESLLAIRAGVLA